MSIPNWEQRCCGSAIDITLLDTNGSSVCLSCVFRVCDVSAGNDRIRTLSLAHLLMGGDKIAFGDANDTLHFVQALLCADKLRVQATHLLPLAAHLHPHIFKNKNEYMLQQQQPSASGVCASLICLRIDSRTVASSSRTGVREFSANNTVGRAIRQFAN